MWYTAKQTASVETKQDKKLRDARQTLKWLPFLAIFLLFAAVLGIVRCVQHPDTEHLLNLIPPLGLSLTVGGYWKKARATLNSTSDASYGFPLLLGLLLTGSGPSLKDMWHYGHMFLFYWFGTPVLALTLFCIGLIVWDGVNTRRAKRQSTH